MRTTRATLYTLTRTLLLGGLALLLLIDGEIAAAGVARGLSLCVETLLPALFPFLVLSELLVKRQAADLIAGAISRPVRGLFGISGRGGAALLLGILCGAPVGTVTATALRRQGAITGEELQRLILFVNNPSAGFLIGAVGGAMLGDTAAGVALFIITWLSALLVALSLRLLLGKTALPTLESAPAAPPPLSVNELTESITRGFAALARIFAFVLFFSCISACLGTRLLGMGLPQRAVDLICGLWEMTAGISAAVAHFPPQTAFLTVAFLASFSGLSICLQIFSIAQGERLQMRVYLLSRLLQGGFALLLAALYLRVFSPALTPTDCTVTFFENPVGRGHLLSVMTLTPLLLLPLALRQQRKKRRDHSRRSA